jgi:hypothetical protein
MGREQDVTYVVLDTNNPFFTNVAGEGRPTSVRGRRGG